MSLVKKEIKIGLITVFALVILGWGFNFLKGHNVLQQGVKYYGIYSNVSGMTESCPIFYSGLKIGSVKDIRLLPSQEDKLLVTFNIVKDIDFPKNSVARIYSLDLMGTKGVEFIKGDSKELLSPDDTLKTYVVGDLKDQLSIEVLPLKDKTEKLIVNFDSLILNINNFFTGENKDNLSQSIKRLNMTMANAVKMSEDLSNAFAEDGEYSMLINRVDSVVMALQRQTPYLDTTFANLSEFSGQLTEVDLATTLNELNNSLKQASLLFADMNKGEGSIGMLLNDKELYYNLVDASANLNRLLMDVRHQPRKYVRFSAFDFGKSLYFDDSKNSVQGIVFQVKLFDSKAPVKLDNYEVAGKYRIFEDFDGKKFVYSIGQSKDYDTIKEVLNDALKEYPKSKVIALENGRLISVNKAIKKIKE